MNSNEPIVVVDDDADDQYVVKEVMARLKLENHLRFFRNGSEALDYLRNTSEKPFIILCDINMPVMDGLELRKIINQEPDLKKKSIPFVYFTTAASPKQIELAYDLTVQGLFIKESTFKQMEKTFKLILDYWDRCKHPNSVQ